MQICRCLNRPRKNYIHSGDSLSVHYFPAFIALSLCEILSDAINLTNKQATHCYSCSNDIPSPISNITINHPVKRAPSSQSPIHFPHSPRTKAALFIQQNNDNNDNNAQQVYTLYSIYILL